MSTHSEFSLVKLYKIIQKRQATPSKTSYVSELLAKGDEKVLKKVHEECFEVIFAAQSESKEKLSQELADLWFHILVMMAHHGIKLETIMAILKSRSQSKK